MGLAGPRRGARRNRCGKHGPQPPCALRVRGGAGPSASSRRLAYGPAPPRTQPLLLLGHTPGRGERIRSNRRQPRACILRSGVRLNERAIPRHRSERARSSIASKTSDRLRHVMKESPSRSRQPLSIRSAARNSPGRRVRTGGIPEGSPGSRCRRMCRNSCSRSIRWVSGGQGVFRGMFIHLPPGRTFRCIQPSHPASGVPGSRRRSSAEQSPCPLITGKNRSCELILRYLL